LLVSGNVGGAIDIALPCLMLCRLKTQGGNLAVAALLGIAFA